MWNIYMVIFRAVAQAQVYRLWVSLLWFVFCSVDITLIDQGRENKYKKTLSPQQWAALPKIQILITKWEHFISKPYRTAGQLEGPITFSIFNGNLRWFITLYKMVLKQRSFSLSQKYSTCSKSKDKIQSLTFVIPGKSTRVRLTTLGEKILRWIGSGLIP